MENELTMLIVDDIEINRMILKAIFEKKYQILEAADGTEAVRALENGQQIDVILLDLVMPKMNGMTFLKWIQEKEIFNKIPIIITTQSGERQKEFQALELGAEDYVVKPYNPSIVERRVENVVAKCIWERRRLEDATKKLNDLLELLPGGVVSFYLKNELIAGSFNQRLQDMLGYDREELELLLRADPLKVVESKQREEFMETLRETMESQKSVEKEILMNTREGNQIRIRMVSKHSKDLEGEPMILSFLMDITKETDAGRKLKEAYQRLSDQLERDTLTGCYQRESFYRAAKEQIKENPGKFAILVLDIDRFKVLNELFGSSAGDIVLKKTAGFLKSLLSKGTLLARIESDRFAICIEIQRLEQHKDELEQLLKNGLRCQPVSYQIMAHVGIYRDENGQIPVERMYDRANLALQTIKYNYILNP